MVSESLISIAFYQSIYPITTFLLGKKSLLMPHFIYYDTGLPSLYPLHRCIVINKTYIVIAVMTMEGLRVIEDVANRKVFFLVI